MIPLEHKGGIIPYHTPVLVKETVKHLIINKKGVYLDATFGGGGHSTEILNKIPKGFLFAVDKDNSSGKMAANITASNFKFIHTDFRHIKRQTLRIKNFLYYEAGFIKKISESDRIFDGIFLDLGISSHQIDTDDRGFSTRFSGNLDMRMDKDCNKTAKDVINTYNYKDLAEIFHKYSQVKGAVTLAKAIVSRRLLKKINTTLEFKDILKQYAPKGMENKYYAKVFQALRIEVNDEIFALKDFLEDSTKLLKVGGRLVIISYHSTEDRLVKKFLKAGNFDGNKFETIYGDLQRQYTPLFNRVIVPTEEEIEANPRSRSAKMRIGTLNSR